MKGLVAFPITPADPSGRVDAPALRGLIRRLADAEVDAVCVLGSTGTYPYLRRDERRRAIDIAASILQGRTPLLAGVGALRSDEAAECAKDAVDAGANVGLLAPLSYTPLGEDEIVTHFASVAAESGLDLCIYDNPATTHVTLGDEMMGRLAAINGVVAVKTPAPSAERARVRIATLRRLAPPGFVVGFSVDQGAGEAMIAGADAWHSVLAGLYPAPLVAFRRAVAAADLEEARRLNALLEPVWRLMRIHSSLRVMYAAAAQAGLCAHDPPRPILPLGSEANAEVALVFARLSPVLSGRSAAL